MVPDGSSLEQGDEHEHASVASLIADLGASREALSRSQVSESSHRLLVAGWWHSSSTASVYRTVYTLSQLHAACVTLCHPCTALQ